MKKNLLFITLCAVILFSGCTKQQIEVTEPQQIEYLNLEKQEPAIQPAQQDEGDPSILQILDSEDEIVILSNNIPIFSEKELMDARNDFISLAEPDGLRRTQAATGSFSKNLGTEEREPLTFNPTGWHNETYEGYVGYSASDTIYNRSHLLAYRISGLSNEERNLITGTYHFNQELMLTYEKQICAYLDENANNCHVLIRATPIYIDDNLVCSGIIYEAYALIDEETEVNPNSPICFRVFIRNCQPNIDIDYKTGYTSLRSDAVKHDSPTSEAVPNATYILNKNSLKFHVPTCDGVINMAEHNKIYVEWSKEECVENGYSPCGTCNP